MYQALLGGGGDSNCFLLSSACYEKYAVLESCDFWHYRDQLPTLSVFNRGLLKNLSKTLELKQSRLLLLQQQAYMKQLEAIQNELRAIQHDHKNLITGLYLHAKDGDTKEIQRYIEKFLLNMDEGIQEQMKWSNQLTSIASPELKGLLLSKMLLAQQHDVFFNLEVATTVEEIKMATNDFIRCMGILLDNAVEAAQCEDENRRVDILFTKKRTN